MTTQSNIPGNPFWQRFLLAIVRLLIKLLLRVEITGLQHIPATGSAVIIINHIAFLDPVMVITSLPRIITPLAKVEVYSLPLWGWMTRVYGSIPVRRSEVDIDAMKAALRVLRSGGLILMAPEGTRSPTYQMQPAKDGAVILALRGDAPLIPIGLTGTHQVKANWLRFRRAPIRLSIGEPFRLQPSAGAARLSRAEISALTTQAMLRLAAQLPPEFRGVYSNEETAAQSTSVQPDVSPAS
jgi:1-acyl-sn-glycerol-3-phosphate acyltransferase